MNRGDNDKSYQNMDPSDFRNQLLPPPPISPSYERFFPVCDHDLTTMSDSALALLQNLSNFQKKIIGCSFESKKNISNKVILKRANNILKRPIPFQCDISPLFIESSPYDPPSHKHLSPINLYLNTEKKRAIDKGLLEGVK
ncbi:hypothetical protein JTE90_007319 [Oedothorax gibbosus]|uniref:Uncharacterized protein n=1 Tax=Oedothorax gibbosus TaxID=931172 RepID=A0AAV6UPT9_9ARAC|nr:hypothetical protein JTE90_007319 [Oedothorax gibbosus]